MVIFVSDKTGKYEAKYPIGWKNESELQNFVVNNANDIFSDFLEGDAKICVIGKEQNNTSGRADILLLDQSGSLFIVETKLSSNTDRKHVMSQLTGYMSSITNKCVYQSFDDFILDCEHSIQRQFNHQGTFNQFIKKNFNISDNEVSLLRTNLEKNISDNSIFGIIIMDVIEGTLKLGIDFSLKNNFKINGIELQKHIENETVFVIEKNYGNEKLFLNEVRPTKHNENYVQGWDVFKKAVRENVEIDDTTRNAILKITNCLEEIPQSKGKVKISDNRLEPRFKKFGDCDYYVLKISPMGKITFHFNAFKDNPELLPKFKNSLIEILPIKKQEILERPSFYNIKAEEWVPKVEEFVDLFKKFYS